MFIHIHIGVPYFHGGVPTGTDRTARDEGSPEDLGSDPGSDPGMSTVTDFKNSVPLETTCGVSRTTPTETTVCNMCMDGNVKVNRAAVTKRQDERKD